MQNLIGARNEFVREREGRSRESERERERKMRKSKERERERERLTTVPSSQASMILVSSMLLSHTTTLPEVQGPQPQSRHMYIHRLWESYLSVVSLIQWISLTTA